MSGQLIHIRLEPHVYVALKGAGINLSKIGNELFKSYIEAESVDMGEEAALLKEIDDYREKIRVLTNHLSMATVKLTKIREIKQQDEVKKHEEAIAFARGLRMNNPLREMLD